MRLYHEEIILSRDVSGGDVCSGPCCRVYKPTAPSPTPTPSASTSAAVTTTAAAQNVSQYLTAMMQQRNFSTVTPFLLQPSPQSGVAAYNGTVSDANGTYAVSVWAFRSPQSARVQYLSMRIVYMGQGTPRRMKTRRRGRALTRAHAWGYPLSTAPHRSSRTT